MKTTILQTPNVSQRLIKPIGIVLHHTGGSYEGAVTWCMNPSSKVSYHCIIDLNGDRTILARDNQRTWHSGKSSFKGKSDCNSFMLGVAVTGDTRKRELNFKELVSIAEWVAENIKEHNMPRDLSTITTHREVSPGRKFDVDVKAEKLIKEAVLKLI